MSESNAPEPLEPFTVGQLVGTAVESFYAAASLHLGESLPDGRKLDATDPMEAWRALLAANALLTQLGPLMTDAKLSPYQAGLDHLLGQLAAKYPTMNFPVPAWLAEVVRQAQDPLPVGDLAEATRRGIAAAEGTPASKPRSPLPPAAPKPKPPGAGLPPQRRSGPLFPR